MEKRILMLMPMVILGLKLALYQEHSITKIAQKQRRHHKHFRTKHEKPKYVLVFHQMQKGYRLFKGTKH